MPPISKKDSLTNKSIPARGKLINMWRNRNYENKKSEREIHSDPESNNDEEGSHHTKEYILELINYYKSHS